MKLRAHILVALALFSVSLNKTYGCFDSYLQNALKISNSDLEALRQRLLEP